MGCDEPKYKAVTNIVSGVVLNESMQPISDVIVTEVNQYGERVGSVSVSTNSDGEFSISVTSRNNQLRFDHVSYQYDTFPIASIQSYVQLYSDNEMLNDVVINMPKSINNWWLWLVAGVSLAYVGGRLMKQSKK